MTRASSVSSVGVTGEAKKNGLDVVRDRLQVSSRIGRRGAIHGRVILVSVGGCLCEFMDAGKIAQATYVATAPGR